MKKEIVTNQGIMIPNYIANNFNLKCDEKYIYSFILFFGKIQSKDKEIVEYITSINELANNTNTDNRRIKKILDVLKENNLITIYDNKITYGIKIHVLHNNNIITMEKVRAEQEKHYIKALEQKKKEDNYKKVERKKDILDEFIESIGRKNV